MLPTDQSKTHIFICIVLSGSLDTVFKMRDFDTSCVVVLPYNNFR